MPDIVLEAENLTKRYKDFYLGPISLSLEKGSITGCIGRNGAGKSTTIKLATNLIKPDSGSITYDFESKNINSSIGYLGENRDLYPDIPLINITNFIRNAYQDQWNQKKYDEFVLRFQLDQKMPLKHLSTGNKVKYLITLELSKEPRILFLDEPTSGLDPIVRDEVLQIMRALCAEEELTVFFSSHITEDIDKIADSIIYMDNGKIVLNATKEEINKRFVKLSAESLNTINRSELIDLSTYVNGYYIVDLNNTEPEVRVPSSLKQTPSLEDVLIVKQGEKYAQFN